MEARNNDEIDLISLFAKIVVAIRQNLGVILLLGALGLVAGYLKTVVSRDVYESKMLVDSEVLTFSYTEKLISTLNTLVQGRNYAAAANKLGLTEKQASALVDIHVATAVADALPEAERNYLLITVQVTNQNMLDTLQRQLITYLENNDYVKVRVRQKRETLQQLINATDDEIKSLEELKAKIYSGDLLETAKGNIMFDPTAVNSKIIGLKKDKILQQNELELANSIQLVEGFTPPGRPLNERTISSTLLGGMLGVLLALVIMGLNALRRVIQEAESTGV